MQLISTFRDPVKHILCSFWSSHIMNVATWESIYSVFPTSTLNLRQMGTFNISTHTELQAYDKYVDRGYAAVPRSTLRSRAEFQGERKVGDEQTLRVPFSGSPREPDSDLANLKFKFVKGGLKMSRRVTTQGTPAQTQATENEQGKLYHVDMAALRARYRR